MSYGGARPEGSFQREIDLQREIDRILSARTPAQVLGVQRAVGRVAVMAAYRRMALRIHPGTVCLVHPRGRGEVQTSLSNATA